MVDPNDVKINDLERDRLLQANKELPGKPFPHSLNSGAVLDLSRSAQREVLLGALAAALRNWWEWGKSQGCDLAAHMGEEGQEYRRLCRIYVEQGGK